MSFSQSKVPAPDFAFPQTVAKTASKDLDSAIKAGNAHAAINALIRGYIADGLIDPASLQNSIKKTAKVAENFKDSPLAALFYALEARQCADMYFSDKWKYDQREQPISPLPEDMTEWSGEQFEYRIAQLSDQSLADPAALKALATADYPDIITANKLTLLYYPTLLDFVAENAYSIAESIDADASKFIETAQKETAPGTPAYILWTYKQCEIDQKPYQAFVDAYNANKDCEYATLLLTGCCKYGEVDRQWAVGAIDSMLTAYPSAPLADELKNFKQSFTKKVALVEFTSLCAPGHSFNIDVSLQNTEECDIEIYKISEQLTKKRWDVRRDNLSTLSPVKTLKAKAEKSFEFQHDTLSVELSAPGYYAIVPKIEGEKADNDYLQLIRCIPAFPATLSGTDLSLLAVANPANGAPMADIGVELKFNNSYRPAGTTDAQGIAQLSSAFTDRNRNSYGVMLTVDGKKYEYDLSSYMMKKEPRSASRHARVLTDRSIYRLGDVASVMAVVYENGVDENGKSTSHLLSDTPINLVLRNANYQTIDTIRATTDSFGRASAAFTLPTEGLTGDFTVEVMAEDGNGNIGNCRIMVSDFRMPEILLEVKSVARDVPEPGAVTISGEARTYSGMPLANANVTAIVSTANWWRWFSKSEKIYSAELTTDTEGKFTFEIAADVLKDRDTKYFMADFDAVSPSGATASASAHFSLGKQYQIDLDMLQSTINGAKPVIIAAKAYGPDGEVKPLPMNWKLMRGDATVAQGQLDGPIDLSAVAPGYYKLEVSAQDSSLAEPESADITLYNPTTDIVPDRKLLFFPSTDFQIPASQRQVEIPCGVAAEGTTYIYYGIADSDDFKDVKLIDVQKGYHTLTIDVAEAEYMSLVIFTVRDCNLCEQRISITRKTETGLKITGEAFRDKLTPGAMEAWSIRIAEADGSAAKAALALDMYNFALNSLRPHQFSLSFPTYAPWPDLGLQYAGNWEGQNKFYALYKPINYESLMPPEFNFYDQSPFGGARVRGLGRNIVMMKGSRVNSMMEVEEDAMVMDACYSAAPAEDLAAGVAMVTMDTEEEKEADRPTPTVQMRESYVPLAIWAPMLVSNDDGTVEYRFEVPNANTTWRLQAVAWTKDMKVGSMIRDFVASKPVMVMPNAPRFLRVGDVADIPTLVLNNSDSTIVASVRIETFSPVTGEVIDTHTQQVEIAPNGNATVLMTVSAPANEPAIGFRASATASGFTDGEQSAIRILPSEAQVIETFPFYLNPSDTIYATTLPKAPDARLSLTFCENPAWTVVSALPGLREPQCETATSAGAAIFAAAVSNGLLADNPEMASVIREWLENPADSALVSKLEQNEDLKQAILAATPWVEAAQTQTERMSRLAMLFNPKEIDRSISQAVSKLQKLQASDGGWRWGDWCQESSAWITGAVLIQLGELNRMGWLPSDKTLSDMISKALTYYDKKVEKTDLMYSFTRRLFSQQISANGQKVIASTMQDVLKNWKKYTDPAFKAIAAQALYLNHYPTKAKEIMASVSQFGVWTQSQGLIFPSINALYNYAVLLEAYATVLPASKEVDGLRQYLIVRKQGNDWGNSTVTSQVVSSILCAGTKWTLPAKGAQISVGGTAIEPSSPIETATGSLRADLSQYAGQELEISTTGAGPAYGAVYAQYSQQMDSIQAHACDDLSIEKQLMVRRGTEWEAAPDTLSVGDRVKVQLVIHCKRNLQFVTIIDERPAGFEPVEQLPGWLWSEGVGFYRENRNTFTGMYVDYMRPGTYLLTYEMNVAMAGQFLSGVATIQSQYAPEISAHSGAKRSEAKLR